MSRVRIFRSVRLPAMVGFATIVAIACNRRSDTASVVVYCSADKEFSEPVFRAYETKTGVKVLPLYNTEETKTAGLTARLVREKARPIADVFWSSDTSRAVALIDQGLAAGIPSRSKSADGHGPRIAPFAQPSRRSRRATVIIEKPAEPDDHGPA